MFNEILGSHVSKIAANYSAEEIFVTKERSHFPNRDAIIGIIADIRSLMFPGYFDSDAAGAASPEHYIAEKLLRIDSALRAQVREALLFRDGENASAEEILARTDQVCSTFLDRLPAIQELLLKDVQAAFDGDPAAQSKQEIILCYPGTFAIFVYRVAHELYVQNVPLIPRLMTEYAHSLTGVDINAGATIGEYFFIDHATGVVVGETTIIGSHCKLYQGVTLGATSTRKGQALRGVKRHPTLEDYVTVYSNASVLGGDTIIGEGTVIGGSAFVCQSTPKNARVSVKNQEVTIHDPAAKDPVWAKE